MNPQPTDSPLPPAARPPIGTPRTYIGDRLPLLYPGEHAELEFEPVDPRAQVHLWNEGLIEFGTGVPLSGTWQVRPTPGLRGWFLRTRYRVLECLFGWARRG